MLAHLPRTIGKGTMTKERYKMWRSGELLKEYITDHYEYIVSITYLIYLFDVH